MKPLAIDLFCGLGGWSDGLISEGWRVIGYDIERHEYGEQKYPGELVLQDVLTIHGSEFKDASLIVASPPCQEYSYMAMPWSRAKAIQAQYLSGKRDRKKLTALFDACFRIQREASEAAGRYIPMVVENVRGAQKWVGKARWNFGSYYLWGDVPALMPIQQKHTKGIGIGIGSASWADKENLHPNDPRRFWSTDSGQKSCLLDKLGTAKLRQDKLGTAKLRQTGNSSFGWDGKHNQTSSKSNARKAASAMIARIPFPLAAWIAKVFKPK